MQLNKRFIRISITLMASLLVASLTYLLGWFITRNDGTVSYQVFIRILERRAYLLSALIIAPIMVTSSTLIFQTMTHNRLITPSLLGFDAWYVSTQTLLVLFFSTSSFWVVNPLANFAVTAIVMVLSISLIMGPMIASKKLSISYLLLLGLVISSMLRSSTSFISILLDPDEFQTVIAITTVNFNTISQLLIFISLPIMIVILFLFFRQNRLLDVLALGQSEAISLGVDYKKTIRINLILVALAMAVSTALVGSLSFIGLIAVHLSHSWLKSMRHSHQLIVSALLAAVMMILGQLIVEWTDYRTQINVIIQFAGGLYLIYVLLKEHSHD